MKKIFSILLLISFLGLLVVPMAASAQDLPKECCTLKRAIDLDGDECVKGTIAAPNLAASQECGNSGFCGASSDSWGMFCLLNTLNGVSDWIFMALVAVAGIMIILGAFTLVTAGGDPEKLGSGRKYILYAAVGLIVGFLARAIPSLVQMIAGA